MLIQNPTKIMIVKSARLANRHCLLETEIVAVKMPKHRLVHQITFVDVVVHYFLPNNRTSNQTEGL